VKVFAQCLSSREKLALLLRHCARLRERVLSFLRRRGCRLRFQLRKDVCLTLSRRLGRLLPKHIARLCHRWLLNEFARLIILKFVTHSDLRRCHGQGGDNLLVGHILARGDIHQALFVLASS